MDEIKQHSMDAHSRIELLMRLPCFASLSKELAAQLVGLMQEVTFTPQECIVSENAVVDSVYLIIEGRAEVNQSKRILHAVKKVPLATLSIGDWIGLSNSGFYSTTTLRTASVDALTTVIALKLTIKSLYEFFALHQLEDSMQQAASMMLRMQFIKQVLPFAKLPTKRLTELVYQVKEENYAADAIIFHKGDSGDKCYLLQSGAVEILDDDAKQLAVLKPPAVFGEATLILKTTRNATAKTMQPTTLLTLSHKYLSELLETEKNIAHAIMHLMAKRAKPKRLPQIISFEKMDDDGEKIVILKNTATHTYFKLSLIGFYIWEMLDGTKSMQELTMNLSQQHNIFAPDIISALISKLDAAGFLESLVPGKKPQPSFVNKMTSTVNALLEWRLAIGDSDKWLSYFYQKIFHIFYKKPLQYVFFALIFAGLLVFVEHTSMVLAFFSHKRAGLLLLLAILPFSLLATIFHELGHAMTVKYFGRDVHYMGVGWMWLTPIAFTDTSDIWLGTRKQRILVNVAGIYVDFILAGLVSICMLFSHSAFFISLCWIFAIYAYVGAFRKLNPFQDTDGYYLLGDVVKKNRLKELAILWLVKGMPNVLGRNQTIPYPKAELFYWLACIGYTIGIGILVWLMQSFLLRIFGLQLENIYLTLTVPILAVMLACVMVIIEIKNPG